jgi:hypothetical protein
MIYIIIFLKGSLSRDFRFEFFFMNQLPPGPWVSHCDHCEFLLKFAEIFATLCEKTVLDSKGPGEKLILKKN